jgi:hypothetical protein
MRVAILRSQVGRLASLTWDLGTAVCICTLVILVAKELQQQLCAQEAWCEVEDDRLANVLLQLEELAREHAGTGTALRAQAAIRSLKATSPEPATTD